jgi:hypothetical protein
MDRYGSTWSRTVKQPQPSFEGLKQGLMEYGMRGRFERVSNFLEL